ncbi:MULTISPECIES: glycosyltransferase family 4 protein [Streptosporangium]|uniref:Glycosyltransferase involved in cell wall biosynthesis n=1 Tax=Streptosporangium brasiliense TaxID=47480 RepID=A0ABT9RL49_9ACTN|nr:glycosyltransferase family 4 protein [Streptosporangium brasiliense]MDP9870024.1 glycosyltransferase involved in cell wall biosynthesis [Streptosporangium brasiliense]
MWLLRRVNERRARRAPAPDTGTVRILLQHAYGMGGTIRTVLNLAGYLARERDVEIVSMIRTAEEPFFPIPPGVRVSFLDDRTRPRGWIPRLLSRFPSVLIPEQENVYRSVTLWTDLRLVGFLRSMRTGVVISTRPGFNLVTALFAPPGVLTVGQEHVALDVHSPEIRRLVKRRYGRLDAFVTLTEADLRQYAKTLRADPPGRLLRIPNAVPDLAGDVSPLEEKAVVAIGRLVHAKGFDRLVRAWAHVAAAHPDWVLRIYGRGAAKAEARLRARIEDAGLQDKVFLMGSSPEIGVELAKASVYVVSSRYEGFGMTILEAMSKGVPVVSFDCPHGPREIITHEHDGLLVRSKKAQDLAGAVCRLIEDRELRGTLGANAVCTAAGYDLNAVGARWDALLADLGQEQAVTVAPRPPSPAASPAFAGLPRAVTGGRIQAG